MRLYYLFAFLPIISFSQAQIIKLYENTNFDGISKSFSGIIKNGNWGKNIPKEEVKKVLKQKYKNFDNKKLQLVIYD